MHAHCHDQLKPLWEGKGRGFEQDLHFVYVLAWYCSQAILRDDSQLSRCELFLSHTWTIHDQNLHVLPVFSLNEVACIVGCKKYEVLWQWQWLCLQRCLLAFLCSQARHCKLPGRHLCTGNGWVACLCAHLSSGTQRWNWKACSSTDRANFLRGTNASTKFDRWQNLHLALTGPSSCWTTKMQTLGLVELAKSLPRPHGPAWNALHPYVFGFADAFAKAMIWSEGLHWNFQSLPCQTWSIVLKVLCMEWVMALVQDLLTKLQLLWDVET